MTDAHGAVLVQWDHYISIAAGGATILAAGVATWGIWSWRHQLQGTTEYHAALKAYLAVTRLRDLIRSTREPFNHMVPRYEGEPVDGETLETVERDRRHYFDYFREVLRAGLRLRRLRAEVELHWGPDGTTLIDALDLSVRKLRGGYTAYFHHSAKAVADPTYKRYLPKSRAVVFSPRMLPEDKDEYGDALEQEVTNALAFFRRKARVREHKGKHA